MYVMDVILLLACKNVHGLSISPSQVRYPTWILVMDILSILPLELLIPMNPLTPFKAKLYYVVQLNDCLKLARIFYIFHYFHKQVGINKMHLQLFQYCANMGLAIMVGFAATYIIVCSSSKCNEPLTTDDYLDFFYISVSQMTTRGYTKYPDNLNWMFWVSQVTEILIYMGVICVTLAHITIALLKLYHHKYRFLNKLYLVQRELSNYNISEHIKQQCLQFFATFWKKRSGYNDNLQYFSVLPPVMQEEIALDASWFALKHSKLFRDMDLPFLRYVSMFVKSKFMQPGEVLYDKQSINDNMVYVISGVVQILSDEDGETPILSFSGGTCLGEVCLMLGYKAKTTVRCKTFCNLQVLDRKDFISTAKVFPKQFLQIRQNFKIRLEKAKEYNSLASVINIDNSVEKKTDVITIIWLKSTLHRLMVKDGDTSAKHECQNIFLRSEFSQDKFIDKHFTAENLDMLAISERLELVTDTVFLKTSCPCILQPDSIILNIWETLIIILAINIAIVAPYYALIEPRMSLWYKICIYMTTLFWWIDIYVQVSVAIKTSDEIIATVRGIFIYRISTISFLVDIIAAVPLELLSCILSSKVTGEGLGILQLNRVIKVWKIHGMFQKWEIYLIFACSCLMYSFNCYNFICKETISPRGSLVQLLWYALVVTQILTGTNMSNSLSNKRLYYPVYLFLTLLSSLMFTVVYGSISAIYSLRNLNRIMVQEMLTDTMRIIHANNLTSKYRNRILKYVETQWVDNRASKLLFSRSVFADISLNIYRSIREEINAKIILSVPLFKDAPEELIFDLCTTANSVIIPPNEVICYAGEFCNRFYIIHMGYCKIASNSIDGNERILGPQENISIVEACLGIPMVNTVLTVTHCRLLLVSYVNFRRVLAKYPLYRAELDAVLEDIDIETQFPLLYRSNPFDVKYDLTPQKEISKSFRKFGYNLKLDSFEEYDYYVPFDRLDILSFVQYFLLRYTILPHGEFFFRWEIVRNICAILSALCFPINSIGTCLDCVWFFLLTFLDAVAWLDIYVRLHTCYYNENGVLVTHPLKTATHYLTHGFLIDFLGVFPVHLFLPASSRNESNLLALLQLNRTLQMYRYRGFIKYIISTALLPRAIVPIFKYFPPLLVLCTCFGSILVNSFCEFGGSIKNAADSPFADGVRCRPDLWIVNSNFKKPLTPARIQAYGIYFITSIVTQAGMLGSTITTDIDAVVGTILAITGYILSIHIVSKILAQYTSQDSTLLKYQDSMKIVRNFMDSYNVNPDLQKQLIAYYEFKWQRKRGKDIHNFICNFNQSLQQDILYDVYGTVLEDTWVFVADSKAFLRSLLLEVSHDVIMKNGYLTTLNDVNKYIHILYKGKASVIAADGTKLTSLIPGSLFGNLDDCPMARQTVTVIAFGHVEILTVETVRFHAVLKNFPKLQRRYKFLTAMHVDYLEGRGRVTDDDELSYIGESIQSSNKNPISIICYKVFDPESRFIRIWKILILIGVCYTEIGCSFYQMALKIYDLDMIIFQYTCDALYIINYYIKRHTAYENECGMMVRDLKMIKERLRENKVLFWLEIISVVPLDIIVWILPSSTFHIVHSVLRLNRLFRFHYIIQYFKDQSQKLNINVMFMRFLYIYMWSTFLIHFFTCVLIILSCSHSPNMYPEVSCNATSRTDKFDTYIRYHFVVMRCFTRSSQDLSYPESLYLIIYFIFLMIGFQLAATIFVAQIYSTLQTSFRRQYRYEQSLDKMRFFMELGQVSRALMIKITDYLKYIWGYQMGVAFPRLLEEAPLYLQEAILNNAFSYHINKHFIFKNCHVDFNRQLVACLRNTTYFRGDYIAFKGSINGCMYFVHYGTVVVLREDTAYGESTEGFLSNGMEFGVSQGLFPGTPHKFTFRAVKPTVILSLDYETWKHLLEFYPASSDMIFQHFSQYEEKYA